MKLNDFFNRLKNKDFFKEFKKENLDLFLVSVFCILSKSEKESDKITFNFYSPSKKSFFSSDYPFFEMKLIEEKETELKELFLNKQSIDIDNLKEFVEKIIGGSFSKIICFLLEDGWKLRVFRNDFFIEKIDLNKEGEIIKREKINLKDSFLNFNKKDF